MIQYFSIFRDNEFIAHVTENTYMDAIASSEYEVAYQITATDVHGNESDPSESILVPLQINQQVQTGTGWNWFSYNVEMENNSVHSVLSSLGDNALFIASLLSGSATNYA